MTLAYAAERVWNMTPEEMQKEGITVYKGRHMAVVRKPLEYGNFVYIMVYPLPRDAHHFQHASEGLEIGGPSEINPTAVGTIVLQRSLTGHYALHSAQSHFKTSGMHPLPRKIERKYSGWKVHALVAEIRQMKPRAVIYIGDVRPNTIRLVKSACRIAGACYDKNRFSIVKG